MSNLNVRQKKAIEELAAALRPPLVERLAAALTECFDAATEKATVAAERTEKAVQEIRQEIGPRFDKQDATLRLMWKQMKGNGKLPIDD